MKSLMLDGLKFNKKDLQFLPQINMNAKTSRN
jgi:hypothetical protein